MSRSAICRACFGVLFALCACSDVTTDLTGGRSGLGMASDGGRRDATSDARTSPTDSSAPRVPTMCGDRACQCDDGLDNDGDGLIDGLDPECTGPSDDRESDFSTGSPNPSKQCRDCFWDENAGNGDDGCDYASACFQGPVSEGNGCSCKVSKRCHDKCIALTPNGCDCFGCCDVALPGGSRISVVLEDTCSLAKIDDPQACPRCIQSPDCQNKCGACELCPGRKLEDLPASCATTSQTGSDHSCDEGQPVCGADLRCPVDNYCQLGCCRYVVQ